MVGLATTLVAVVSTRPRHYTRSGCSSSSRSVITTPSWRATSGSVRDRVDVRAANRSASRDLVFTTPAIVPDHHRAGTPTATVAACDTQGGESRGGPRGQAWHSRSRRDRIVPNPPTHTRRCCQSHAMVRRVVTLYERAGDAADDDVVYLSMRAVMDIGGAAGSGRTVQCRREPACPDHIAAFHDPRHPGDARLGPRRPGVTRSRRPELLLPMWWVALRPAWLELPRLRAFQATSCGLGVSGGAVRAGISPPALAHPVAVGWTGLAGSPRRAPSARLQAERPRVRGAAASPGAPGAGRWVVAYVLLAAPRGRAGWRSFHAWT